MEFAYGIDSSSEAIERRITDLASRQHGVFSRAQALALGAGPSLLRRRAAAGRWEQCFHIAFRICGMPPSWRQDVLISCLAWGEGAVASHRAAGALRALPGIERTIELTVPPTRRRQAPGIIHRGRLDPADVTVFDAIPVTTVARTLIDLCGIVDADLAEEALDDALRRRLVSRSRLRWRLEELGNRGRPGTKLMRSLLDARGPATSVPQTVFETRLYRELKRSGLPKPVAQYEVREAGRVVAVPDFAYPAVKLAIEADSYRRHSGRARWEHDLERRNLLTRLGWNIIHVTWSRLTSQTDAVMETIAETLSAAIAGMER